MLQEVDDIGRVKDTSLDPLYIVNNSWEWYQEWNNALFFHWYVAPELLQELIPPSLSIDTLSGKAVLSLVAYSMNNIRLRNFPLVEALSNFHQINLRTYVRYRSRQGIYLLHIEAQKCLSVFIAKLISGMQYTKATMYRILRDDGGLYFSHNEHNDFFLEAEYKIGAGMPQSYIDDWLLNRYYLFFDKNRRLYGHQIYRREWNLRAIRFAYLKLNYSANGYSVWNKKPDMFHYSDGVMAFASERMLLA